MFRIHPAPCEPVTTDTKTVIFDGSERIDTTPSQCHNEGETRDSIIKELDSLLKLMNSTQVRAVQSPSKPFEVRKMGCTCFDEHTFEHKPLFHALSSVFVLFFENIIIHNLTPLNNPG